MYLPMDLAVFYYQFLLFLLLLYHFGFSIISVIDFLFSVDCENPFEKSRLRNEQKIN